MGTFQVNYNAGGTVDEVKKIKLLEQIDNISNVEVVEEVRNLKNVEVVQNVELVDEVGNLKNVETVEGVDNVKNVEVVQKVDTVGDVENVQEVNNVSTVGEVSKIRGFATLTQPYNMMEMFEIPASYKDPLTGLDYELEVTLPNEDVEIMAISMTCSGYGENDHYDLFFNGKQWFKDWYCSEVKEGLFLGTSTYVYAAPPSSKIKLIFKNDSGTSKKLWLGVRMLVN